jgi:O-antigen ligase
LIFIGMLVGAGVAYRASAQLPLTLAGLALFGGLALVRPDLALLVVPLSLPLYFIPKGIFDARFGIRDSGIYLPMHEILLVVALVALGAQWAWRAAGAGRRPTTDDRRPTTDGMQQSGGRTLITLQALARELAPVGLFVLAALWGVVIAEARGAALRELRWVVVEPLLFVGAAALVARRWKRDGLGDYWLAVTRVWLVGGAVVGLVGILQLVGLNLAPLFGTKAGFSEDSFLVEGVRRVTGLYGHPNNLGLAMGRFWPVAAALTHLAFWGAASRREGLRRAVPYAVVTALCLGGLLASFSRGAYMGAAAAVVVLAVTTLPRGLWRSRRVLAALGVLMALGLLVAVVVALNIERLNPFGASSGVRVQTWASALAMLRDHPLGIGLDQFGQLYPRYISPDLAGTNEINTAHPHNLFLDLALRLGPLGLVAVAWLLVRLFADARGAITRGGDGLRGAEVGPALLAGVAAATVGALVHGLVDQLYFWPDLAFAFWLFIALGRAYRRVGP